MPAAGPWKVIILPASTSRILTMDCESDRSICPSRPRRGDLGRKRLDRRGEEVSRVSHE
jgi:hypothetical protein